MPTLDLAKTVSAKIEHERLLTLINSMADGVIAVDENSKIVLSNGAALSILDVNNARPGTFLHNIFKPVDRHDQPVDVDKLIEQSEFPSINRDLKLSYSDGSTINLYLSVAPVHLGFGRDDGHGYVLVLRDITREKSLEDERNEFISVASHELRTPIAIAEGNISNVQLLSKKSGDSKQINQALKEAHNQVEFLGILVNDLSMLSRAERGTLAIDIDEIDVRNLVKDLASNYRATAAEKGLKILLSIEPKLAKLHSSELYVREILQNFITNAIKYTEKGHVKIAAKAKSGGVEISVADTGIGIGKSDQSKIFNKFFRSEDFRTRQTNGTGLGLYVNKKLVNLISAKIEVISELNHGSTFSVYFPNLKK